MYIFFGDISHISKKTTLSPIIVNTAGLICLEYSIFHVSFHAQTALQHLPDQTQYISVLDAPQKSIQLHLLRCQN